MAHSSVYRDPPLPLLAATSITPHEFDRSVQTEFRQIWSNAVVDFICEGQKPGPAFVAGRYHHAVFYTAGAGWIRLSMTPFPTAYVAALSTQLPSTRKGRQAQRIALPDWFARLRTVQDIAHLLPLPRVGEPAYSPPHSQPTAPIASYPLESTGTDWKYPNSLAPDSLEVSLPLLRTYLEESLLNSPEFPIRLFLGIEDGTGDVIGCYMPQFEAVAKSFATSCLSSAIFPTLRPNWFQLVFHKVLHSHPSNWNALTQRTNLARDDVQAAFVLARGRAAAIMSPDGGPDSVDFYAPKDFVDETRSTEYLPQAFDKRLSVSKEKLKSAWKHLRKADWEPSVDPSQLAVDYRYVLEVQLVENTYAGSFFRTELGDLQATNDLRLCFPFPHPHAAVRDPKHPLKPEHHPYTGLDPCAVWLRARASTTFDVALSELFFSPLFVKLVVRDSDCAVLSSLNHYLLGRQCDWSLVDPSNLDTASLQRDLARTARHPRLVVALSSQLMAVRALVQLDYTTAWNAVILVDSKQFECRVNVGKIFDTLADLVTVLDVRAVTLPTDPLPSFSPPSLTAELSFFASTTAVPAQPLPLDDSILLDPIPTTTVKFVRLDLLTGLFKQWLLRERPSEPPMWELMPLLVETQQAERLSTAVTSAWDHPQPLQVISILKTFPASGATCLLRLVAYKQRKRADVLWIKSIAPRRSAHQCAASMKAQLHHQSKCILLCTDEIGKKKMETIWKALQILSQEDPNLRCVWLKLKATTVSAWSHASPSVKQSFIVSPYVDPSDLTGLIASLAVLGHVEALHAVVSLALTSGAHLEDRLMFVFVLAATKGVCTPIREWVAGIHARLQKAGSDLLGLGLSIAFVSAFAADHLLPHQTVLLDPVEIIESRSIQGSYEEAIETFRELFPSALSCLPKGSYCLHPFLARLFLSNSFELYWGNEYLDWKSLRSAWKTTVDTLSPFPRCAENLRALLSQRAKGLLFSPLVIDAWSATSVFNPKKALEELDEHILGVLPPSLMGFHRHILLSRLYRCAAQQYAKPLSFLELALTEAGKASKLATETKANLGELFTASQNLAVMYGVAFSIDPKYFDEAEAQCNDILLKLYNTDNTDERERERYDLIKMGQKWCSRHRDYWDTELRTMPHRLKFDEDASNVIVRGWNFNPADAKFRMLSERNVIKPAKK